MASGGCVHIAPNIGKSTTMDGEIFCVKMKRHCNRRESWIPESPKRPLNNAHGVKVPWREMDSPPPRWGKIVRIPVAVNNSTVN